MKIAVCQVSQETNTFSDRNFDLDDFMPEGWILPENLTASFRGTGTYLGGAIRAAEEWNADLVPIHTARSEAGYPLKTEVLTEIMDVICSDLEAVRDEIDGLFLAQHGGGTTRDHTSLEEYVMERVRAVIGDKPMMSSLDMHCNITPAMLRLSDGLFPIKEFPHVDTAQAGYKAMTALICTVRGEIRPWMGWMSIPQIYPNTAICTLMNPMKEVKAHFAAYAEDHGLMDASVCQGFSGGDTYMSGASVLVMADGRNVRKEAEELEKQLQELRDGKAIEQPIYDYITSSRQKETIHVEPSEIVIVEGIMTLHNPELREQLDLKVFVDADGDDRLIRVVRRDIVERGRTVEAVLERYQRVLKPMHEQFIEPCKRYANVIIPQGGHNNAAINMMAKFIKQQLKEN